MQFKCTTLIQANQGFFEMRFKGHFEVRIDPQRCWKAIETWGVQEMDEKLAGKVARFDLQTRIRGWSLWILSGSMAGVYKISKTFYW